MVCTPAWVFFCQCMGLTDRIAINHPLWFLSILIFGGAVLYSILRNCRESATSLVIPLICIVGFPIYLNYGKPQYQTILHPWLVRGVAEMALGIMTAVFMNRKSRWINGHRIPLNYSFMYIPAGIHIDDVCGEKIRLSSAFSHPDFFIGCFYTKFMAWHHLQPDYMAQIEWDKHVYVFHTSAYRVFVLYILQHIIHCYYSHPDSYSVISLYRLSICRRTEIWFKKSKFFIIIAYACTLVLHQL